ncbi:hypothetical protein [Streptomyces sp. NBC_01643]|uniref:hypothetical protein n=1 Tax=Streptomyces sp. NBC_01643 TaxID=2975906 RepID=UPI00386ACCEA|nr:hypothetical protein OHB03_41225 [Streptomyces sp. NBC_01643]
MTALEAAGACIADFDLYTDRGWFTFLAPGPGESLGSCVSELPCSLMELPEDVAAAVAADRTLVPAPGFDRPLPGMEETGRGWRPPAAYVTDPEVASEPGQVCLDLERALAAYCQHPAWVTDREQQLAAGHCLRRLRARVRLRRRPVAAPFCTANWAQRWPGPATLAVALPPPSARLLSCPLL